MPTAAERGAQTRAALMAAAVAVIAERGWGAATTRMVPNGPDFRRGWCTITSHR